MNHRIHSLAALALLLLHAPLSAQNTTEVGLFYVQQNNSSNTNGTSVTLTPGLGSSSGFQTVPATVNRGDYHVNVGNGTNDRNIGTYVVSVAQNGRDNAGFGDTIGPFYAVASPVIATAASPAVSFISSFRIPNGAEVNIDVAAGFFPYSSWLAGYSQNASTLVANAAIRIGTELVVQSAGVNVLNLQGINSSFSAQNGVLLASESADGSTFFANTQANANGSFTIYTRDNTTGTNGDKNSQRGFTFAYLNLSDIGKDGLTALGRINNDGTASMGSANFTVTKGPVGRWHLSIPGHSVDTGTLLICGEGGGPNNTDNIVSYEWDALQNHWVIESRDIVDATTTVAEDGATPEETMFSFAFFEKRTAPTVSISLSSADTTINESSVFKIVADAVDADGEVVSVQFLRNGQPVGSDTLAPYELNQSSLAPGNYTFTAVATDDEGRPTTSAPILIQIYGRALTTEVGLIEVTQFNNGNDSGESVRGIVRPGSSTPSFSIATNANGTSMTDRGDYHVRFGNANDVLAGTVITSVTQNGRDNTAFGDTIGLFYAASNIEGAGANFYYLPVNRVSPTAGIGEVNINMAVGFFPYGTWLGGYARNPSGANGGTNSQLYSNAQIRFGQEFRELGSGVTTLDLRAIGSGYNSSNGIVLANHAKNESNYATVQSNADGTFTLRVRDNAQAGGTNEQDPVSFVFLPLDRLGFQGLTALGRVKGDASTPVVGGPVTVTKGSTGRWLISIPGESPDTGTLLVSMAGGQPTNTDNVVSYEWDPANQYWMVESRDMQAGVANPTLENLPAAEDAFSFAFFKASAQRPTVSLSAPAVSTGRAFTPATFAVQADAADEDGQVVSVEFFVNGVSAGVQTQAPFQLPQTALAPGSYLYTARVRDDSDYVTVSEPLLIEVVFADVIPANTALWFDGINDHVAMPVGALSVGGPATRGFTLECWFRRTGTAGQTTTSGSLAVVPLIAKGRQEGENNNSDVNYLFGLTPDGKLGIDFEAFPATGVTGGTNYPLVATHDSVETGVWRHAVASYDSTSGLLSLYLDGILVGTRTTVAGALPRFDSNHSATIGTAYNTTGAAVGAFPGVIDEVRVWNYPRSANEIQSTMAASVRSGAGLVGRFGLDEGQGEQAVSSLPDNLVGALSGGPIWTLGAPITSDAPRVVLTHPAANALLPVNNPVLIAAAVGDSDGSVALVEFFEGAVKIGERTTRPYVFEWSPGMAGSYVLSAVVTDNSGLKSVSEAVPVTLSTVPALVLTEVQSNQSSTAPVGAADYWELTNFSGAAINLEGYTWTNAAGNFAVSQAWAVGAGVTLAAGESILFTTMETAAFRAWWGVGPTTQVIQSVGAPDLGENDTIRLFNASGVQVFAFAYAAGGFVQGNGDLAVGGHAGVSGGGDASAALVWVPGANLLQPRYAAASAGVHTAGNAVTGSDVGSPGAGSVLPVAPATLVMVVDPPAFSESAENPAATGSLFRDGDSSSALTVNLSSSDTTAAMVPVSVTFGAGESSVSFEVAAVNDFIVDTAQVSRITASAPGALTAFQDVLVEEDNDQPPPFLLLTEVQSLQSAEAPTGAADYFEITHFGDLPISLEGYTWDTSGNDFNAARAWALPAGASIAPGESVVITLAEPAAFRAWWGLNNSVKVYQASGAPNLGENDRIVLYTQNGVEVFSFSYGQDAFTRQFDLPSVGGHAGISAGAAVPHVAAVWNPISSYVLPTYLPGNVFRNGGRKAAVGSDVGSPGVTTGAPLSPPLPAITTRGPLQFKLVSTQPLLGAEISAYDPISKSIFVTSSSGLQVLAVNNVAFPELVSILDFTKPPFNLNATDVTSVAVSDGVVAVAIPNAVKQDLGSVVFLNAATRSLLGIVQVGVLPDMICFAPNGLSVLTANEGEMLEDGSDPSPGSVSIIDVSAGFAAPPVTTVGFGAFDAVASDLKAAGVRLYEDPNNPGQLRLPSLDFEPEYIAVAPDGLSAMVTLQEANAVAILDLVTQTFTRVVPLGEKDFSSLLADFSDRDGAGGVTSRNLTTGNPVFGLYMPDAIASYQANGQTYYVTANEGDDRNDFRTETILLGDANYVLDPIVFPDASALKTNARLGRLVVSNSPGLRGDLDNDGEVERILAYGGRSISVLDAAGNRVWDSGDMIERLVAELGEPWFDDRRSDNKGPEPEGVTIGEVDGRIYAFVALERSRAVMVFEVTDPTRITQAGFVSLPSDLNPESMTFIPASESPNGEPLLAVANETSNTLTFFSVSRFTLQMLHLSNAEAGALAPQTAPLLAALVEGFEPTYDNTLILAGGDTFAPGPFLTAGTDPVLNGLTAIGNTAFARPDIAIHNLIGVEASAVGTHEWALGSRVFANALRPDGAWAGAQFPFLSANLDYSADEAALERLVEVPINGVTTTVPLAPSLKGKLAPVSVIEKGGEKIGLIGVTNQLLASIASPNGTVVKGTQMNDMDLLASQVQPYINELEAEGVNKIVLLSHLPELALEIALAEKLRGVDVVLAGGSEARLGDADDAAVAFPGHAADFAGDYPQIKSGTDGAPVLIVGTDKQFTYLGRLVVDFDLQGRVELGSLTDYTEEAGAYAASPATVAAVWDIAESEVTNVAFAPGTRAQAVRQITDAVQNVITTKDGDLLGFTRVYLEGADAQVRGQETNLGNLVTDANRALASSAVNSGGLPVVALLNAGNLRTSIGSFSIAGGELARLQPAANPSVGKPAGGISQLDVEAVLRANHKLMVFETNALGLKTLLEHGLALGMNQDRFQQVSGAQFAWDPARPAGDRITSIALLNEDGSSGVPIYKTGALAAPVMALAPPVIRIAVTNALANGADDFPAKAIGENFRFVLSDRTLGGVLPSASDFTEALQVPVNSATEQDALALFLQARHASVDRAFDRADTLPALDGRIQNRLFRADMVPPVLGLDSDGDGLTDLDELLLGGNPYAALRVGDLLDLDLSKLLREGETLRVSGTLPRGVRFDPITGKLSGLIGAPAGLFDVNVILTNAARGVRSVNLRFGLKAFPARLLGSYEALLEGVDGQPKGIVRIAATQPSVWTANVDLLGTARRSARGSFALEAGQQRAQVSLVFNATKTTPALRIALVLDADSPLVTGTFDNGALSGNMRGFRLVNFGGSPPDVRRMTAVLDAGAQDGVTYPAGYGWLRGSVNTSGAVNLAGQLGDGQSILVTTRLSATGQALLWSQPYREKATSFIGGVMAMPNVGQPAARLPALTSGSFWFKAANPTEKSYAAGFAEPLPVAALSSGFTTVRTSLELESLLGLTASTLAVEIEGAGLSNAIGNTPVLPSAWTLGTNFSLLTSTPGSVPWAGKIAKADGGLTGTLTLPQGPDYLAGRATVTGVLLPAHQGTSTAVGAGLIRVPIAGPKGSFRTSALLIEP